MVVSSLARLVWPLLLCCGAEALRVDIGPVVSRRSFAALGALAALPANAAEGRVNLDQIKVLSAKARALRAFVRSTSSNRRLFPMEEGSNNYVNVEKGVRRGQTEVLMPLLTAMTAAAAAITLPDAERQKQLANQPLLLKGHFAELGLALDQSSFDEYTSKTTEDVYPGGKVERELEEVCDTAADFLALATGKEAPQRDARQ